MISFDVDAIVAKVAAATVEMLRPAIREEIVAVLDKRNAEPRVYSLPQLAERFGRSPDAMRMYLRRSGRELGALAKVTSSAIVVINGKSQMRCQRVWSAVDVDAFLARGGGK